MKKFAYSTVFLALFFLSGCGTVQTNTVSEIPITIPPGRFYFHSKTCAHCAIVDQYISDNKISQKLYFVSQQLETDPEAVAFLKDVGKKCTISDADLGVPLFWDGTKCYLGDQSVIDYFKQTVK